MKTELPETWKKFNKMYNAKIKPKLLRKAKLDSEIDKLYSERSKLNSKRGKLDSEIDKLYSERSKFYSEINKLNSEINKLYSEINKLYSEILADFYKFDKENDCVIIWKNYDFKLKEIRLKSYNEDKTGFVFIDSEGNITEELFKPKPDEYIEKNGYKYKLVE